MIPSSAAGAPREENSHTRIGETLECDPDAGVEIRVLECDTSPGAVMLHDQPAQGSGRGAPEALTRPPRGL